MDTFLSERDENWNGRGLDNCHRTGCTRSAQFRLNVRVPDPTRPLALSRDAICWTIRHRCPSGTERLQFCGEHLELAKAQFGSLDYRRYVIAAMLAQGAAPGGPETCRLDVETLPSLN